MIDNEELEMYKEEVKELTELLKNEWTDLKDLLEKNKVDVKSSYLFGYYETEDGEEVGVIFTNKTGFQKFEVKDGVINILQIKKEDIEKSFPQVKVFDDLENFSNW